jgi:tetratricopeptide (TPR) repeat protein
MVFPAPAPLGSLPARRWLDRLSGILSLAAKGVLVLVEGGPERLGDLVRHLIGLAPDLAVLTRAPELAQLAPGSTAVLWLREQDFDWLNGARPVVRGQRIVLFGSEAVVTALGQRAFDFYDWISHRVEAPSGPPEFAVRALRRAVCARPAAIVWKGGELGATFAAALPGRSLVSTSAVQPYEALVEALSPRPKCWVAITGMRRRFELRRMAWGAAEAGRIGRVILVEPRMMLTDLPSAHGRLMPLEEAAGTLATAGVPQPARAAALLDLEPEAIARAAELARAGVRGEELELRALSEAALGGRAYRRRGPALSALPERVERATEAGDLEVAERWATAWRDEAKGSVRATAALARVRALQGRWPEAKALLAEIAANITAESDDETRFEVLRARGHSRAGRGEAEAAARDFKQAIALAKMSSLPARTLSELHSARAIALLEAGKVQDAEHALDAWKSDAGITNETGSTNPQLLLTCALVLRAKGQIQEAAKLASLGLRALKDKDHPVGDLLVETLAGALIDLGRFADAERLTRAAVNVAEQRGRAVTNLLYEHGRALAGLGRFAEAEQVFRRVLAEQPYDAEAAMTNRELALCLIAQGRAGEAEPLVDQALAINRRAGSEHEADHVLTLHAKALLRGMSGDHESSAALLREVLRNQERLFGRDEPTLAQTLIEYAEVLMELDRPRDAMPLLRRALSLANHGDASTLHAMALTSLARAETMQRLPQAADTARRALSAWSATGQEPEPDIADGLAALVAGGAPPPPISSPRVPRARK